LLGSITIRDQKNFATGVLYMAVGGGFAAGATFYNLGSPDRMGPGYFPFWLGLLLAAIGAIVLFASLRTGTKADALPRLDWKALGWILLAITLFGVLLMRLGFVASLVILVLVSSRASHEFRWTGALLNALVLVAMCLGAFVYGLGLQLPLWPSFIDWGTT
jgi:hypothetical protein